MNTNLVLPVSYQLHSRASNHSHINNSYSFIHHWTWITVRNRVGLYAKLQTLRSCMLVRILASSVRSLHLTTVMHFYVQLLIKNHW